MVVDPGRGERLAADVVDERVERDARAEARACGAQAEVVVLEVAGAEALVEPADRGRRPRGARRRQKPTTRGAAAARPACAAARSAAKASAQPVGVRVAVRRRASCCGPETLFVSGPGERRRRLASSARAQRGRASRA